LILGLDARPGLEHESRNIGGKAEREDEREQPVDPGAQGKLLPHCLLSESEIALSRSEVVSFPIAGSVDR
jgi:hypothetical protein